MRKAIIICLLIPVIAALCLAFASAWDEPDVTVTVTEAQTDGNALILTISVVNAAGDSPLYGTLDYVYVNGFEARQVKTLGRTSAFLNEAQLFTVTYDISDLPAYGTWTVAAAYSVLKPNEPIRLIDSAIGDDIETYNETITGLNAKGFITATEDGDILLPRGTYNEEWLISGRLEETGKMTVLKQYPLLITLTETAARQAEWSGILDMDTWTLRIRKARVSLLSAAVIADELFPADYDYARVLAESRYLFITDENGSRDFYTGHASRLSDPVRVNDGEWMVTFYFSTLSVTRIPGRLRLTPFTYDALMSPVYDTSKVIEIILSIADER